MQTAKAPDFLLANPERLPLLPPESVAKLGSVLIVAPHPDDESLGCGGLLALLAKERRPVRILVMTDGSRSHPNSESHPAAKLASLRELETAAAMNELGIPASAIDFMRFPDCGLPTAGTSAFEKATAIIHEMLSRSSFDTLFIPWRRDPHCDHEASWKLLREAAVRLKPKPRWLEYPVWAWTDPKGEFAPRSDEAFAWRLDTGPVLVLKSKAIAQHRSQLGEVIRDDPEGFVLRPEMLTHFSHPWELFIEPRDV